MWSAFSVKRLNMCLEPRSCQLYVTLTLRHWTKRLDVWPKISTKKCMTHPALDFDKSTADSRWQFRFGPRHFATCRFTTGHLSSATLKQLKYLTKTANFCRKKINTKISKATTQHRILNAYLPKYHTVQFNLMWLDGRRFLSLVSVAFTAWLIVLPPAPS